MPEHETPMTAEAIIQQHFPRYGPYDHETTVRAAQTLVELVRYLDHAADTKAATGVPYPSTAHSVITALHTAFERMPNLLTQISDRCETLSRSPNIYSSDATVSPQADASMRLAQSPVYLAETLARLKKANRFLGYWGTDLSPISINVPDEDE